MSEEGSEGLSQDDVRQILSYLDLSPSPTLPTPPLTFLSTHIDILPYPLLKLFADVTTPRERASVQRIKSRRLLYATQSPLPQELTAQAGRLRWPLLWERMGGSSALPPPSAEVKEEETWVKESFLKGQGNSQQVKKLGGFLRGLAEEREIERVVGARVQERKLDQKGEEFDEESDEEEGPQTAVNGHDQYDDDGQDDVRKEFERKIMELFVDGIDTVSYTEVDFQEPAGGDPTADRDAQDAYFQDEAAEPAESNAASVTSEAPLNIDGAESPRHRNSSADYPSATANGDMSQQNGKGDYDY